MDMTWLYLCCVLLFSALAMGEDPLCSVTDAQKCMMERKLQYDGVFEQQKTNPKIASDSFRQLCKTQIKQDRLGDCFIKWTQLCSNNEAHDIKLEWKNLNDNITKLCRQECPNLLDVSDCKNMTNSNGIRDNKFESFCSSFNTSIYCAQEVLSDCIFGFAMFSDLMEPKVLEYWRYICKSDCENIDDTVGVIVDCAPLLSTAATTCLGHDNFKRCVLDSPIVCKNALSLLKYKYRKYSYFERVCSTTTTISTTPTSASTTEYTTSTAPYTAVTTTPTYITDTSRVPACKEETKQEEAVVAVETLAVDTCLTKDDLEMFEKESNPEMEKVMLLLRIESCLHNLTDDLVIIENTKSSLPSHIRMFYHKTKQNGWNTVKQALSGCKERPSSLTSGCSGHMYGFIPCNTAASRTHCILKSFLMFGLIIGALV